MEAEIAESLRRVEAGGIPVTAERRLKELGERGGSFTSDLSVSGFALCHQLGLQPLSQVMGSSIYQMGYQGTQFGFGAFSGGEMGYVTELSTISDAWNEARRLALNRLEEEATHAGADAVIGVQVRTGAHDWAEGAIEYMVVGTAVRRKNAQPNAQPVMTELSVSDYANLRRAGIEPLGIVAWTSVFFVVDTAELQMMGGGLGGRLMFNENQEMTAYTRGVYSAREQAMERLNLQAQQMGASGIVGVRIGHTMRRQSVSSATNQRGGMVITFDVIGTAVHDRNQTQQQPPKTTVDLSI